MENLDKEFKVSSWSIDNRTSIYILTIFIAIAGTLSYIKLPKERFPDIVIPTIYVTTIYPGTSPTDMENVVTKQLEKQIKAIAGVKKVTSTSIQNFSNVVVEFNTGIKVSDAKQKVKDAVDKARPDLPNDLPNDPNVVEVDFSEVPMMYINISGDFDLAKLKEYAEDIQDKVESMKQITRVDIVGALDREIQVNVDRYKMESANVTLRDIQNAVSAENVTISAGELDMGDVKRAINIKGSFIDPHELDNIVIRSMSGAKVYLKDIAEIRDGFKTKESYARLGHKNVITLNVVKRSGENLIESSDQIREIVANLQKTKFPKDLKITITGDQATSTRVTLHDLINTIIIGFILVTVILMFFMGVTNAIFVAASVPLSMFIAFLVMPTLGFSLNMIVLFAFLLALGIVVDDAIVVIENTHRIFDNGKVPIKKAAKAAAGEVFLPVLSGTMTTLAPFIPLAFWGGIIGKFMFFLPVTLIVTLLASLLVAYIINPVFAVDFMKPHIPGEHKKKFNRTFWIVTAVFGVLIPAFYFGGNFGMGNFSVLLYVLYLSDKLFIEAAIQGFQEKIWPKAQNGYEKILSWAVYKSRPWILLGFTLLLLVASVVLVTVRAPKVVFFPQSDPNFVYVYITLPVGTHQSYTDSITKVVEDKVYKIVEPDGKPNPVVESVISNVAIGAGDPQGTDRANAASQKGKVTVAFVEFGHRHGVSTSKYLDAIRKEVKGIPGAVVSVEQERGGPPVGKAISIEFTGDKLEDLITASEKLKYYLDSIAVPGVEELKSDQVINKPELEIVIDRERANVEGISTGQIGQELRNALFGQDRYAKFRDVNDEYPIQVRFKENQRKDIDAILNTKITYRDMNMGGAIRQVPLSSLAKVKYVNSYGGINRKNQKRIITLGSNVLSGYNANEVVARIASEVATFPAPEGVSIKFGGEQEDQKETSSFLGNAMLVSLGLIFIILVTQFNSISKPLLILSEIFFSIIGVLLGLSIFKMDISIVMTGIGIVALAGIVVRNGILIVEFIDILRADGMELREAIILAGKTRMTPVLLTATATISGLIPLAVGLNIDFVTMFTELDPNIFLGGDSVAFWGPLSWTMIFGLSFATFLTLVLVPCMYYITEGLKLRLKKNKGVDLDKVEH